MVWATRKYHFTRVVVLNSGPPTLFSPIFQPDELHCCDLGMCHVPQVCWGRTRLKITAIDNTIWVKTDIFNNEVTLTRPLAETW